MPLLLCEALQGVLEKRGERNLTQANKGTKAKFDGNRDKRHLWGTGQGSTVSMFL